MEAGGWIRIGALVLIALVAVVLVSRRWFLGGKGGPKGNDHSTLPPQVPPSH
jgi:hypothetical protein